MYKDEYHPGFKKDLKKLDKPVIAHIRDTLIDRILEQPDKADILSGNLYGIYSYHFKLNKVEYRICYMIEESEKTVYFLMTGKRENFYNILQNRIKNA